MRHLVCLLFSHDWRHLNTVKRYCSYCGIKQVRYPYEPEKWRTVDSDGH